MSESKQKGMGGVGGMIDSKRHLPQDPEGSFAEKTVLVTGANSGLGFEAALKFARLGASIVILAARDRQKCEEAKSRISSATGVDPAILKVELVDLQSFASVQDFASRISSTYKRLDTVLLQAGVCRPSHAFSPDGWELTLQVNILSTALLSILLMPKLRKTSSTTGTQTHLIIGGSEGYLDVEDSWFSAPLSTSSSIMDHFNAPQNFAYTTQYFVGTWFKMVVLKGLVEDLKAKKLASKQTTTANTDTDPIILVASPGLCRTNQGRDFGFSLRIANGLFQSMFARTAEQGSRALVSAALLGQEAHGKFWRNDSLDGTLPVMSPEVWEKLWRQTWGEIKEILLERNSEVKDIVGNV